MKLSVFIDRVLTDNNKLQFSVSDVETYVCKKARELAGEESSIGVDDETVKNWILEYDPAIPINKNNIVSAKNNKKIEKKRDDKCQDQQMSLF